MLVRQFVVMSGGPSNVCSFRGVPVPGARRSERSSIPSSSSERGICQVGALVGLIRSSCRCSANGGILSRYRGTPLADWIGVDNVKHY